MLIVRLGNGCSLGCHRWCLQRCLVLFCLFSHEIWDLIESVLENFPINDWYLSFFQQILYHIRFNTVHHVLSKHLSDNQNVLAWGRCLLKTGSFYCIWHFRERNTRLFNRGGHLNRCYCNCIKRSKTVNMRYWRIRNSMSYAVLFVFLLNA